MATLSDNVLKRKIISQKERNRQVIDSLVENILSREEEGSRSSKCGLLPDRSIMTSRQSTGITLPKTNPFSCFVVDPEPSEDQIQGASLELRVGDELFVMKGEFTSLAPEDIPRYSKKRKEIKEGEEVLLKPGNVYVIKSLERLRIPNNYYGISDARSSLARIGCGGCAATTRNGIIDSGFYNKEPEFVYFKIEPQAFPIILKRGETRPIQIRFRENGSGPLGAKEIEEIYGDKVVLRDNGNMIKFNHDLLDENGLVLRLNTFRYYVQKKNVKIPIDISKKDYYNSEEFFEYIENGECVILKPNRLYLFGTKENISFDKMVCGDLVRSPDTLGQGLSNNFARFFDPGFSGEVTLEAWVYKDTPWQLFDGQYFGRILIERLDSEPLRSYEGTYKGQKAPRLPKMFKQ